MNPVRERALTELRAMVLKAFEGHDAAVWLFGSCARDEVKHPDDIDVAIFPRRNFPSCLFIALVAQFEDSTIPYDIDLHDLRKAGPGLLDEVLWTGIRWRD